MPVKVSNENGEIAVGDLLTTSSTPGVAMKATHDGQIIGNALNAYSGNSVGTIDVFVNVSYHKMSTDIVLKDTPEKTSSTESLTLKDLQVDGIATISADLHVHGSSMIDGILNVIGSLTAKNLIIGEWADICRAPAIHQ